MKSVGYAGIVLELERVVEGLADARCSEGDSQEGLIRF